MNKPKLMELLAISGEILIIIGAALWITRWDITKVIYAIGVLLFATGRLFMQKNNTGGEITLRRLYTQQNIGVLFVILSALLMFFYQKLNGIEIGDYVIRSMSSAWLLPFVIFVVLEVYTTFRISSEQRKQELKIKNRKENDK